MLSCVLF